MFTLPDKLSSLILGNRRELYRLLMHAAWESLRECIESERGMQPAALLVLHTWNQRLEHHPHVHALVPGSGPALATNSRAGPRWIAGKMTQAGRSNPAKPFLVDNVALGREFYRRFIRQLTSLRRRGKLKMEGTCAPLQDALAWKVYTDGLAEHDWCVFIERPPTAESTPEHVLKYLARYLTGGPISDRRLVRCEHDVVTFLARNTKKGSSQKQVAENLSGVEFTRRQQPMRLTRHTHRPSWRDLFYGPDHHAWFES